MPGDEADVAAEDAAAGQGSHGSCVWTRSGTGWTANASGCRNGGRCVAAGGVLAWPAFSQLLLDHGIDPSTVSEAAGTTVRVPCAPP